MNYKKLDLAILAIFSITTIIIGLDMTVAGGSCFLEACSPRVHYGDWRDGAILLMGVIWIISGIWSISVNADNL